MKKKGELIKTIFKSVAGKSILIANVSQGLWWVFLSIGMIDHTNYEALSLQVSCTIFRISQQIIIDYWCEKQVILHLVSLFYSVLYIETFLFLQYDNPFGTYANCLLFIVTYRQYLSQAVDKSNKICKIGFPCYVIFRNIILIFTEFNFYLIESLAICVVVFLTLAYNDEQFNCQCFCSTNKKNILAKSKIKKFDDNDSVNQLQFNQSLGKSFSRVSIAQTPLKSQSIYLKEMSYESKLIQCSNLGQAQKLQKSQFLGNKTSDLQFHQFYQNLINSFPQGILILNQSQQVSYQNNKCEKLLECSGSDQIVEKIRMCLNSAKMPENENDITNLLRTPRFNKQINQQALFRIVKELQKENLQVDILDILLQPQKYLQFLEQRLDQLGSQDDSKTEQLTFQQQMFIYEWLFESTLYKKVKQKKLKMIIIPTFMTGNQQEYISMPSHHKCPSKLNIQLQNDVEMPVLLIMIKNITSKHQFQKMKNEQIIHHSLIKSFSHELRTPLNSCQHMLNLIKTQSVEMKIQEYVDIAQCSISLLIHQINDILDYAAIQSFQFQYRYTSFTFNQIAQEIYYLYNMQMKQKKIKFIIKIQQNLSDALIFNDQQRVLQILVNLLNNASKYTREGGHVKLSIKQKSLFYIHIKVKDDGIGIEDDKLALIQNSLIGNVELGVTFKTQSVTQRAGLGLSIAAKIVEGLIESNNNQLMISSTQNKGTKVQFQIQNFLQTQNDQYQSSNLLSQLTGRFNQSGLQQTLSERKFDDRILIKSSITNSKMEYDMQLRDNFLQDSESSLETPKLNDREQQQQIQLPISPEYFSHKQIQSCHTITNKEIYSFKQYPLVCKDCKSVLIVDDIPFNQMTLRLMLQNYQIESDQAFDGFQAIEKVKSRLQHPCQAYKLIFMDIEMPGINGFQTSKQILDITGNQSYIVICSAYDTQENFTEGQKVGVNSFLPKPVNQKELEVILKRFFTIKTGIY
ncbi:unnamed protein product (macronuclear) [Paramecium tetraurelia]|uniref:Uncharacterized protein n=1 Tax=Paramecium tetraurelia TaxID=5888 RepID=A0DDI2_PARTE|nr:uncharacterized protein GSPATT00015959001 [Paramecium tetraurelia]CAK81099.1 unnamed protein product [Paramecium tetraurelia]|eukprot:XP_001448496.1 hypothetical protein (macronuclear) [Paramecium tetraurelia strain d4-2]